MHTLKIIKALGLIAVPLILSLSLSTVAAQNKVVVIPLGSDSVNTFAGEATISIPVTSLVTSGGDSLTFFSPVGIVLEESVSTTFGSSIIIPADHKAGTTIYVDLYVYNSEDNGACRAVIRSNYGRSWKPGEALAYDGVLGFAPALPVFTDGGQTNLQTYRFGSFIGAGDSVLFGMFRNGGSVDDNCGDVGVVGLNIRYQRE